jgi:hypothetical protein
MRLSVFFLRLDTFVFSNRDGLSDEIILVASLLSHTQIRPPDIPFILNSQRSLDTAMCRQ